LGLKTLLLLLCYKFTIEKVLKFTRFNISNGTVYRGGGGDPSWHQAGTKTNKMNSIYDFTECAKYLIREGFVHKDRLGAIGVSAGGLLVGAAINLHPHLFSAAILKVTSCHDKNFHFAQKAIM
jgi:protease II